MSLFLYVLTFWCFLAESGKIQKKHVDNSITPARQYEPAYNISLWISQLHIQQCVIVEIGDKYCGIFVEYRSAETDVDNEVEEYFLGLCDLATLRTWKFCPPALENEFPNECVFHEHGELSSYPARVHRRLCDITGLAAYAESCNCSNTIMRGQKLFDVTGFPTCFVAPLPDSLCIFGNVCGVSSCNASTINNVHTVKCSRNCLHHQPFCEKPGPQTTLATEVNSYWSDWSDPVYTGELPISSNGVIQSQAVCINKNTGMGAIDCLGPGTNCCPANAEKCRCYIYMEDGVLKLTREVQLKVRSQFYRVKRTIINNTTGDFESENRMLNRHKLSRKQFRTIIRKKIFDKNQNAGNDYVEEDDDEDMNDGDEDIVLEEVSEKAHVTTTEHLEKSEVKEMQRIEHNGAVESKNVFDEEVIGNIKPGIESAKHHMLPTSYLLYFNIVLLMHFIV